MWPWRLGYSGAVVVVPVEVIHLPAPRIRSRRSRAPLRYSYRSRRRAVLRACDDDVCWYVSMFRWIQDEDLLCQLVRSRKGLVAMPMTADV